MPPAIPLEDEDLQGLGDKDVVLNNPNNRYFTYHEPNKEYAAFVEQYGARYAASEAKSDKRRAITNEILAKVKEKFEFVEKDKKVQHRNRWEPLSDGDVRKNIIARLGRHVQKSKPKPNQATASATTSTKKKAATSSKKKATKKTGTALKLGQSALDEKFVSTDEEKDFWFDCEPAAPLSKRRLREMIEWLDEKNWKEYFEKIAKVGKDKSIDSEGGTILIYLDPDQPHGAKVFKKFLKNNGALFEAKTLVELLLHRAVQANPKLKGYQVVNPCIRFSPRGPQGQPISAEAHVDIEEEDVDTEVGDDDTEVGDDDIGEKPNYSAVFSLSEEADSPVIYDMTECPEPPSTEKIMSFWLPHDPEAPKTLKAKMDNSEKALELIRQYGKLIWTTCDNQRSKALDQFSLVLSNSSLPHQTGGLGGPQITITYSLRPARKEASSNSDSESESDSSGSVVGHGLLSKEKFFFLLFQALQKKLDQKEKKFLLYKFCEAVAESAKQGGVDYTFEFPEEHHQATVDSLNNLFTKGLQYYEEDKTLYLFEKKGVNEAQKDTVQKSLEKKQKKIDEAIKESALELLGTYKEDDSTVSGAENDSEAKDDSKAEEESEEEDDSKAEEESEGEE